MLIVGFEKLSLVNFDNEVSATIFLNGCNFRCPFCHNFEFVVPNGESYKTYTIEEILDYLKKRVGLLSAVCITGGEATLNNDLKDLIIKIKELGFKVKLDTNGTNPSMVKELFESNLIDYVAIDIKNSKELYSKTIGLKNYDLSKVEETINYLMSNNYDYEFRTTIIKEFHNKEEMEKIGKWVKGAKRFFLQKFEDSEYVPDKTIHSVELKEAIEFKSILEKYIDKVSIRGYK